MSVDDLFGKPEGEESFTGFCVSKSQPRYIVDKQGGKTGFRIGGPTTRQIIDPEGNCIAIVSGPTGKAIFDSDGIQTGYFIGGPSGNQIHYNSNFDKRNAV